MTSDRLIRHLKRALVEAIELIRSPRLAVRLDDEGIVKLQRIVRMSTQEPT